MRFIIDTEKKEICFSESGSAEEIKRIMEIFRDYKVVLFLDFPHLN